MGENLTNEYLGEEKLERENLGSKNDAGWKHFTIGENYRGQL